MMRRIACLVVIFGFAMGGCQQQQHPVSKGRSSPAPLVTAPAASGSAGESPVVRSGPVTGHYRDVASGERDGFESVQCVSAASISPMIALSMGPRFEKEEACRKHFRACSSHPAEDLQSPVFLPTPSGFSMGEEKPGASKSKGFKRAPFYWPTYDTVSGKTVTIPKVSKQTADGVTDRYADRDFVIESGKTPGLLPSTVQVVIPSAPEPRVQENANGSATLPGQVDVQSAPVTR